MTRFNIFKQPLAVHPLILILMLALSIRVVLSLTTYSNANLGEKEYNGNLYYILAQDIIEQGTPFYMTNHPYKEVVGPITGWINATTILLFGDNWLAIFLVTSIASTLIVLLIYLFTLQIFDRTAAVFASIWASISPLYLYFVPTPGKDMFMALLLLSLVYMFYRLLQTGIRSYSKLLFFSFVLVVSFHLDERFVIFAPIFFFFLLLKETQNFKRFKIKFSLLLVISVILFMIPWTMRNYYKYDRLVILTVRTERLTDKIFGNEPKVTAVDNAYDNRLYDIKTTQVDSVLKGQKKITDGGWKISEAQRQAMLMGNMPHLFTPMEAYWSRFISMFKPVQFGGVWERTGYFYYEKSLAHNLSSLFFYGIMLLFSIPGYLFLFNKNKFISLLILSIIIGYGLLHVLTIPYTNWRYRLPLDAFYIITGSVGLVEAFKYCKLKFFKMNSEYL